MKSENEDEVPNKKWIFDKLLQLLKELTATVAHNASNNSELSAILLQIG